jgi:hypothetical protein
MGIRCLRRNIYIRINCTMLGTGRNPAAPLLVYTLAQTFHLRPKLWILSENEKSLITLTENFNSGNLYSKPRCHVVSNAFSISKNTAAIDMLLLKFKVTWSVSLIHWSIVLWRAQEPNWLERSRPLSAVCLWTIFRITFSNCFLL